jgi:quinol-cytochrome oxidoreductase complex cytochrome b subunit
MIPFHPYFTFKDIVGFFLFFLIVSLFIFYAPNYLGHPDNFIPANPLVTPASIVPEWYMLINAILKLCYMLKNSIMNNQQEKSLINELFSLEI